ncbi:DUF4181 domain-containing protein [Schnuerera sp. xch1]|nr:DUF4181 domain-containing protein [Schnuerera sp. xch1]
MLSGIRAFMEWKFEKDSKRYALNVLTMGFILTFILGVELLF